MANKEKPLWGLWAKPKHGDGPGRWYLDTFERPIISHDRRLMGIYAVAHNGCAYFTYSVRKVRDDGQPVDDGPGELEKALAAADKALLAHDAPPEDGTPPGPMWGLWREDKDTPHWVLDSMGLPIFSSSRALVEVHLLELSGLSVRAVDRVGGKPVGYGVYGLEKALADMAQDEDAHFLVSDEPAWAVHPGLADMTSRPGEDAEATA